VVYPRRLIPPNVAAVIRNTLTILVDVYINKIGAKDIPINMETPQNISCKVSIDALFIEKLNMNNKIKGENVIIHANAETEVVSVAALYEKNNESNGVLMVTKAANAVTNNPIHI
jgi:hypothetical protein